MIAYQNTGYFEKLDSFHRKPGILFEIKVCGKFYHRHIIDIEVSLSSLISEDNISRRNAKIEQKDSFRTGTK